MEKRHLIITVAIFILLIGVGFYFYTNTENNNISLDNSEDNEVSENDEVSTSSAPINLSSQTIDFKDGTQATFRIAEPFELSIVADGLGKARFMTWSPDNRLFVPDMVDYRLSRQGKLYILEDFNETTGTFETKNVYLSGLRGLNSVAFYEDESGKHWLYLALTEHLVRYPYTFGDTEPSGDPEIILEFPNTQDPEAKSVVWHITRTIIFHKGRFYISIGSGCNACEQTGGELRGLVASIKPDGSDVRIYADGLRNAVGLDWVGDDLYVTENGADHLGVGAPDEPLYKLTEGESYGWPHCYESNGESVFDTTFLWNNPVACEALPGPVVTFEPHSAPLGLKYFEDFHPILDNTFLVALHGSFDPGVQSGYEIVRVTLDGQKETFIDGFQDASGNRYARPVDFIEYDENSFFFSDDFGGRIYRVNVK